MPLIVNPSCKALSTVYLCVRVHLHVCVFVGLYVCAAGGILFYRPVEQKYGSRLESNAAGRHLEELCRFLLGIIGTRSQMIAWNAQKLHFVCPRQTMLSYSVTGGQK